MPREPSPLLPVRVGAYAGGAYPEAPRWVDAGDGPRDVEAVEERRREPERLVFRVRLKDGRRLLVYYLPKEDRWLASEVPSSTA